MWLHTEIEVPVEFELIDEDDEEEDFLVKEDSWNDLGLAKFLQDQNGSAPK